MYLVYIDQHLFPDPFIPSDWDLDRKTHVEHTVAIWQNPFGFMRNAMTKATANLANASLSARELLMTPTQTHIAETNSWTVFQTEICSKFSPEKAPHIQPSPVANKGTQLEIGCHQHSPGG